MNLLSRWFRKARRPDWSFFDALAYPSRAMIAGVVLTMATIAVLIHWLFPERILDNWFAPLVGLGGAAWVLSWNITWQRAKLAADKVSDWDKDILDHRKVLESHYDSYWKGPLQLSRKQWEEFAKPKGARDRREALKLMFNRLEILATLYDREMLDADIIDALLKDRIIELYIKFRPLIRLLEVQRALEKGEETSPVWPNLEIVLADWGINTLCDHDWPADLNLVAQDD